MSNLCGPLDQHLRQIERHTGARIHNRGHRFELSGAPESIALAGQILRQMYAATAAEALSAERVLLLLQNLQSEPQAGDVSIKTRRGLIRGRTPNQQRYLANIQAEDVNFGVGPAGTGKTYLAVAAAVEALDSEAVRRIVLVRPAVEAGERLGFLPGDMSQKVDPYLRPMYDALYAMMGVDHVMRLIERNVIEIAPLAFMRGRSLNESFVLLDEAQNTSVEQMKMFLTRMGFGSRAVVTGDVTQIDLPSGQRSGLQHAVEILDGVEGIGFTFFSRRDVVRHPLVKRIVKAYEDAAGN